MAKLKKGSAAAKAWGRKMKRLRNSKSKRSSPKRSRRIKQPTQSYMARRRKRSYSSQRKRRSSNRGTRILGFNVSKLAAPILYGMLRQKTSGWLASKGITQKIPLGNSADEAAMFLTAWAGKKFVFKQKGVMRDALTAGQNIELARIGEDIINGNLNLGILSANTNQAASTNGYVFAQ